MSQDLNKIESIFEMTLASLADRYGKRIAYYQSLPTIVHVDKDAFEQAAPEPRVTTATCPIYEDGFA